MRTFLRSYRGTHPLGRSASPCFAAESTREGTLMSLSEGAPARSGWGWHAWRCGVVRSDIRVPELARAGAPVGTRTNTVPQVISRRKHAECLPKHYGAERGRVPSLPNASQTSPKESEGGRLHRLSEYPRSFVSPNRNEKKRGNPAVRCGHYPHGSRHCRLDCPARGGATFR